MHTDETIHEDDLGRMMRVEGDSRLGRIVIEDERDEDYPMRAALPDTYTASEAFERGWRYWWPLGYHGNQGYTPHCVAYAWVHWGEDGPRTREPFGRGEGPFHNEASIYHAAQRRDRWPGENYDGTSVRAGAKVLRDLGYISEYRWAAGMDDILNALFTTGPVVFGSWWYEGMMEPDEDGYIYAVGQRVGGHAYVLNGINRKERKIRLKNSWGLGWGDRGSAWLSFDDVAKLLEEQGEACLAIPEGGR